MPGSKDAPAVAALDIGTSKVTAAIAVPESDGLRVLGLGRAACAGVRRGAVIDLRAVTIAVGAAAERARRVAGRPLPPITLGSAGGELLSWNHEAEVYLDPPGEIEAATVQDLLTEVRSADLPAGYQIVHAIARDYAVDGYEGCKQPVGMAAGRIVVTAHLVACRATLLRNLWKAVDDAGLEIEDFAVAGLAAGEAVLTEEERRQGAVVVDFGAGATQVGAVVDGEPAATAVVPLGGAHVTSDIAVGLGIPWDAAEEVKQRHATADSAGAADRPLEWLAALRPLAGAAPGPDGPGPGEEQAATGAAVPGEREFAEMVRARTEEQVEGVAKVLRDSGLGGRVPAGIVLTGGGSRLRGLSAVAMRGLGLPVRLGAALGADGTLGTPECAAVVGLLQIAAQRVTGGRRLPTVGRTRGVLGWLASRRGR